MVGERARRIRRRIETWARVATIGTILGLAVLAPTSYVAVHQSSTPEFCKSCHIMDPYYDSWARSAHGEIVCTACHFEPGLMGTLQGKFQALTQLTKYITLTAGTRPWAHVADASCTQCHSLPDLVGPLDFGGIAFDHGPHLAQVSGMQLRCVTCHSHVLIDEHFAVQKDVCFTCHFMPTAGGAPSPRTANCGLCHGPPQGELEVAGASFVHAEWLANGVECRACHADTISGSGAVLAQHCKSCHAQPELLAQIDSPERMHRIHVTDHKVECFECHIEIEHGLSPGVAAHARSAGECGACHGGTHDAAFRMYAGVGALGVDEGPSRMFATKVTCEGCHSGRLHDAQVARHGAQARLGVAGEVDCLHCHGTPYAGMLAQWQTAVGGGLADLAHQAAELSRYLESLPDAGARGPAELLAEARHNIEFVRADGSRGAHNVHYALAALRAAAGRLDTAWEQLGAVREVRASRSLPPPVDAACSACHVALTVRDPLVVQGSAFQHASHLGVGIACAACHLEAPPGTPTHGSPAFPRSECASCHHAESPLVPDPTDCSRCHSVQISFLQGTLPGFEGVAVPMAEKGCENCHAEPPDLMNPQPALCVLCHEDGYDTTFETWRTETTALMERVRRALAEARPDAAVDALEAARRALALVERDGSRGVHAFPLTEALLRDALRRLGAE